MEASQLSSLNTWQVLTATAGLIAFHIGLYTLVGRERKSPYVINSIFPVFLCCLFVASLALIALIAPQAISRLLLQASILILVMGFLYSIWVVWKTAIRFWYFVDRVHFKQLPIVRHVVRWWRGRTRKPTYSTSTVPISETVNHSIIRLLEESDNNGDRKTSGVLTSLAIGVRYQGQANDLLAKLSKIFLLQGYTVQYLTASRHPIEFILHLQEDMGESWKEYTKKIISIDAYSSHFAFIDSIYKKKDEELERLGVDNVRSKMTYAGMHTASSEAFNRIKDKSQNETRKPTLVIYEDAYALSDLESADQYRIFVRHVMPSERMWDGMFTVFVESAQADYDWRVLSSYASMTLDLRQKSEEPLHKQEMSPLRKGNKIAK